MPHKNALVGLLATAVSPGSIHNLHGDHVPEPIKVFYGVTSWVPARDATYQEQRNDGAWANPRVSQPDCECGHCLKDPAAAGMEMCPGCHRFADKEVEGRLASQRRRSAIFAGNAVPLTPKDPPAPTPEVVFNAKWDDVTESKSHPQAKQDQQTKLSRAKRRRLRSRSQP